MKEKTQDIFWMKLILVKMKLFKWRFQMMFPLLV